MRFISKFISAYGLDSSLQTKLNSAVFCIPYSFIVNVSYISLYFSCKTLYQMASKQHPKIKYLTSVILKELFKQQSKIGKPGKENNVRRHSLPAHYSMSLFYIGQTSPITFQHFLPLLKATDRLCLIHFQKLRQFFGDTIINNKKSKKEC